MLGPFGTASGGPFNHSSPVGGVIMPGFLSRLFRSKHPLKGLCSGDKVHEFVEALNSIEVVMIGAPHSEGLAFECATEQAVLAEIESAARSMSDRTSFSPFRYHDRGSKYLPFFTTMDAAEVFCGAYCGRENRLFQFPAFVLSGAVVGRLITADVVIIMDPQSDEELVLSPDQSNLLNAVSGDSQGKAVIDISGIPQGSRQLIAPTFT